MKVLRKFFRSMIFCGMVAVSITTSAAQASVTTTVTKTPVNDTFVFNPAGITQPDWWLTKHPDTANQNFGGAGSIGVASSTVTGTSGANVSTGAASALFRYDFDPIAGTITSLSLKVYITNGLSTSSAYGLFCPEGHSGTVSVYWLKSDISWTEGSGAPHATAAATDGSVTYNSLRSALAASPSSSVLISSFYYDNSSLANNGAATFTYDISTTDASFLSALASGDSFTLYLATADGSQAAFNIKAGSEYLTVTSVVPEPSTTAVLSASFVGLIWMRRKRGSRRPPV